MNTTSLAVIQADELDTIQRTGRMLAVSGYFDGRGDTPQAIAQMATKIIAGREMGFGPFASVNGIHIISGKPAMGANLMAAAIKASGRYDYRVREMTDKLCRIEYFERVDGKRESIGISEFTDVDAKKAGTKNMDKFARNMLFARAMSNGVRWYCPDIMCGNAVYVPEELGAEVDGEGNVVETAYTVTPQPMAEPQEAPKPVATSEQLVRLNELGKTFYNGEWPEQLPKLCAAVSKGATDDPADLLQMEIAKLITGIEKKMQQVAEATA